tara:strand:- start:555 stop:1448 length:894 start_codon:yes stop_codon:yes gene_type:complete
MKSSLLIITMLIFLLSDISNSQINQPWTNSTTMGYAGGGYLFDIANNFRLSSMITKAKRGIYFSSINYPVDINGSSILFNSKFRDHFYSFLVKSVNYGTFDKRTINNELIGEYSADDLLLQFGYAKNLKKRNISYGINSGIFLSNIDNVNYSSLTFSPSIIFFNGPIKTGIAIMNYSIVLDSYRLNDESIKNSYLLSASSNITQFPIDIEIDHEFFPKTKSSISRLSAQLRFKENIYINLGTSSKKFYQQVDMDFIKDLFYDVGCGITYNTSYGNFNFSTYSYGYLFIYGLGFQLFF